MLGVVLSLSMWFFFVIVGVCPMGKVVKLKIW